MNSLFQQLNKTNQNLSLPNNIRQMINVFKMNPKSYIEQQVNRNPQLKTLLDSSNGNYEQVFRNMCKQYNVNPDDIINMLK